MLQFLCAVANVAVLEDGFPPDTEFPGLCTAGALLSRQRNLHMSALHNIVGVIFFHGNASKQVCIIIIIELLVPKNSSFTEGSCAVKPSWPSVSPDATLSMVNRLAAGYDIKVLEWMQKITRYHSGDFH